MAPTICGDAGDSNNLREVRKSSTETVSTFSVINYGELLLRIFFYFWLSLWLWIWIKYFLIGFPGISRKIWLSNKMFAIYTNLECHNILMDWKIQIMQIGLDRLPMGLELIVYQQPNHISHCTNHTSIFDSMRTSVNLADLLRRH
jgi:hypothetical protein